MRDAPAPRARGPEASPLAHCRFVTLPRVSDHRGHLTFVEAHEHVPFPIARVYYLYGMPDGAERGGHAYTQLEQVLIAINGSFDVLLGDGTTQRSHRLDRPDAGLYVAPRAWRTLRGFSADAICLVLASRRYDERDCQRDFDAYRAQMTIAA
jgi:hypothetical protein